MLNSFTKNSACSGCLLLPNAEEVFSCHCGKTYRRRRSLWRHKRYECGKEPLYSCQLCSSIFKHKANLKIHYFGKHKVLPESNGKTPSLSVSHDSL